MGLLPIERFIFFKNFCYSVFWIKIIKKKEKLFFSFVVILPTPSLQFFLIFCFCFLFFVFFVFFFFLKRGGNPKNVTWCAGRENEKRTHAEITNDDVTHLTRLDRENIFRVSILLYLGYYIMMCVCVCVCVWLFFVQCVRRERIKGG